jgi:hypothetical protein
MMGDMNPTRMSQTDEYVLLSTGQVPNLGNWHDLTKAFFGPDSAATAFWTQQIDQSVAEGSGGRDEMVLQDEGQCMYLNIQMHTAGAA